MLSSIEKPVNECHELPTIGTANQSQGCLIRAAYLPSKPSQLYAGLGEVAHHSNQYFAICPPIFFTSFTRNSKSCFWLRWLTLQARNMYLPLIVVSVIIANEIWLSWS